MKQSDITPEVIRLSKELAEHWRMEIYEGCWIARGMGRDLSGEYYYKAYQVTWLLHKGFQIIDTVHGLQEAPIKYIPIPSISDCLKKLREFSDYWRKLEEVEGNTEVTHLVTHFLCGYGFTKTQLALQELHKDLLSALLEVLKEQSDE